MHDEMDHWILTTQVGVVGISYRETPDGSWETVVRDLFDETLRFVLPGDCQDEIVLAGVVELVDETYKLGVANGERAKVCEIQKVLGLQ